MVIGSLIAMLAISTAISCACLIQTHAAVRQAKLWAMLIRPDPERRDLHPAEFDAVSRAADHMSVGATVMVPREVAHYAEFLTHRLSRCPNALEAMALDYESVKVAGCRRALSAAIEATDRSPS